MCSGIVMPGNIQNKLRGKGRGLLHGVTCARQHHSQEQMDIPLFVGMDYF